MERTFSVVPLGDVDPDVYLTFARPAFGREHAMAAAGITDWLYRENPHSRMGLPSGFAAYDGDTMIGCVHDFQLTWACGSETFVVGSIHNLHVRHDYRGHGVGGALLRRVCEANRQVFTTGASPVSERVLDQLSFVPLAAVWYRKILAPLSSAYAYAAGRLGRRARPRYLADPVPVAAGLQATCSPDRRLLARVAGRLSTRPDDVTGVAWDEDTLYWRFFHPLGPRHALFRQAGPEGELDAVALVSLGRRRGLNVARVNAIAAGSPGSLERLLAGVGAAVRRQGAHVLMVFTTHPLLITWLSSLGWRPIRSVARTMILRRPARPAAAYWLAGGAGDLGFEAVRHAGED